MDILTGAVQTRLVSFQSCTSTIKTLPEESGQHFLAVEVKTNGECV